jgi:nicotinamidase-related amidase
MHFAIDETVALILVDVQRDFCAGGALPVPEGEKVIPRLNQYIRKFVEAVAPIVATRDWHPETHCSFQPQGGPWPPHCVQHTKGAEFHPDLQLPARTTIVSKAQDADAEAYSGFDGTDLATHLTRRGIRRLFIGGLATDYCVKHTVFDALAHGFEAVLLEDATQGVNVAPDDSAHALREMAARGAQRATVDQVT